MFRVLVHASIGLGTALLLSGPALALQITGITVAPTAANTANDSFNVGVNRTQVASATSITGSSPGPVADEPGASVGFDSRYTFLLAADREAAGGSLGNAAVSEYTITFTVLNPTGALYELGIDTSRIGALTLVDDGSGNASASLGAVVGQIDAVVEAGLGLVAQATGTVTGGTNVAVNQSTGTVSLFETALSRTYVLTFTSSSSVTSAQEEAAIRMGIAGLLSSTTADDYPGVGLRTAANDGHFVSVSATLVPEPSARSLLLLVGGWLAIRRR